MSIDALPVPVEHLLPPPDQGSRVAAHAISRAVGYFQRAVVSQEVVPDFVVDDPLALIAQTQEAAWERVDRHVLATAQHSRRPVTERIAYLSWQFLPETTGGEGDTGSLARFLRDIHADEGAQRYSFTYGPDGRAQDEWVEDAERDEAASHAYLVLESERLAEERTFQPQEELVVLHALEHMAARGHTEFDRAEAATLIQKLFAGRLEALHAVHAQEVVQ